MRCDWGTHVTALGQPARFIQAGDSGGRRVVVVSAPDGDPVLAARCLRREPGDEGESAYYLRYEDAALRLGLPPGSPLTRDQATSCLRPGDRVLVGSAPAMFMALKWRGPDLWLLLRAPAAALPALRRAGAQLTAGGPASGITWGLPWHADRVPLRLLSAQLPSFARLRELDTGTPVTLGTRAVPARLCGTFVEDGTREFVVTRPMAPGNTAPGRRVVRFQEAGLRLVVDGG